MIILFKLVSDNIKHNQRIPLCYTNQKGGNNMSPSLHWYNQPSDTISFAIICEDRFVLKLPITHWFIYNIPANISSLERGISKEFLSTHQISQSYNWKLRIGYTGPNPIGGRHHYYFTIYALNTLIKPRKTLTVKNFHRKFSQHILDTAQIIAYSE